MSASSKECPSESFLRKATREVATALANGGSVCRVEGPTLLTPVSEKLGCQALDGYAGILKFDRAAVSSALEFSKAMSEVIQGDGPEEARFIRIVKPLEAYAYHPYNYLHRIIDNCFVAGWEQYEQQNPRHSEQAEEAYVRLLEADSSSKETSQPLSRESFRRGVEAGSELANFARLVGVARAKKKELRTMPSTSFRQVVADVAIPWFRRRGSQHVRMNFQTSQSYQEIDAKDVELVAHPKTNRWSLACHSDDLAPYESPREVVVASPTTGCFLQYAKIQSRDKYNAYENMIFAGLNLIDTLRIDASHPVDFYSPAVALGASREILEIEERLNKQQICSFKQRLTFFGGKTLEAVDAVVEEQEIIRSKQLRVIV